jgi:hypothetical protein
VLGGLLSLQPIPLFSLDGSVSLFALFSFASLTVATFALSFLALLYPLTLLLK